MKPFYPKAVVQPVTAEKLPNDQISIRYRVYAESAYYSKGVDYQKTGDVLRVVIDRCALNGPCDPMAPSVIPLGDAWEAEVHLPYHGEKVVLIHADGEQQIYP